VSGESTTSVPFDPEVWPTWPIPEHAVNSKRNDLPFRLDEFGLGWVEGFEKAMRMTHVWHATGEWDTNA
jgi:hypothetical protein